jgi:hypothetical protein
MRASGLPHLSGKDASGKSVDYSDRLVDLIKEVRGAGFLTYNVLENRLLAATVRSRLFTPALIKQIVSDLRDRSKNHRDVAL